MGIKERHERDRESVRRQILDAARDLFVSDGYPNVSIRKIADRIEYSPAAIYGYFPSKDDIFFALAEEGFHLLTELDEAAVERLKGLPPLERIRASLWRLYEFSRDHPQYFSLIFVDRSVPRISREWERFAFVRQMKSALVANVEQCIASRVFRPTLQPAVVVRLLMLGVVGVAVLRLSDRLGSEESADLLAEDILQVTLSGLQSVDELRSRSSDCHFDEKAPGAKVV